MADRVYEKLAQQATEIAERLRLMKPTGREIDAERIGGDLAIFASGLDSIAEARDERAGK